MKEVKIHYFVPETHAELESLVGKSVGVKISGANVAEPMIFTGKIDSSIDKEVENDEYEFLRQASDREDRPFKEILGFRKSCEDTFFDRDGVRISNCNIVSYKPHSRMFGDSPEYKEKLQLLKYNNLWRKPLG